MLIRSDDKKGDIIDDPLIRYFRDDVNKEGYGTPSHAKLQLEDIMDFLVVIFPLFDFLFVYDQSSGHTKLQENGFVASNVNVSYGDIAARVYDTIIKEFRPYDCVLEIGLTQSMIVKEQDPELFWIDNSEKL